MALYLHTNLSSLAAQRATSQATKRLDVAYERISSGLRINSAKDDPAGLQTSDSLTEQIDSLYQTNRNAQNAISYAQTAEGALDEITQMLQRIRTLSIQSANGTNTSSDRRALQEEVDELNEEICRIARDTTFGGEDLLSGAASVARFQISPDANSVIKIDLSTGFDTDALAKLASFYAGTTSFTMPDTGASYDFTSIFQYRVNGNGIDISSQGAAEITLAGIDYLITAIDSKRAELGAIQNRLESTIRNQSNISENVSSSRAQIRDTDWAAETAELTAQNILQQGAVSILTQANSRPEIALQMLQSS